MNRVMNFAVLGLATIVFLGCRQSNTTSGSKSISTSATTSTVVQKKLTVKVAEKETIRRGKEETLKVSITRTDFKDPVKLKLTGLPKGVTSTDTDVTIAAGSDSQTVMLKADATAELGEHMLTLTAMAPGVDDNKSLIKLKVAE